MAICSANLFSQPVPVTYNGDTLWVYPADNSAGIEWGGFCTDISDCNGANSYTDGKNNTEAIVSQLGQGNPISYRLYKYDAEHGKYLRESRSDGRHYSRPSINNGKQQPAIKRQPCGRLRQLYIVSMDRRRQLA
ncbi:MAG: hypothetical protein KJ607_14990 [Bacteroidetes bacterium]|nr:hypothetical protein [Bacteroidota bacterium]